jgi:hypothetical protein
MLSFCTKEINRRAQIMSKWKKKVTPGRKNGRRSSSICGSRISFWKHDRPEQPASQTNSSVNLGVCARVAQVYRISQFTTRGDFNLHGSPRRVFAFGRTPSARQVCTTSHICEDENENNAKSRKWEENSRFSLLQNSKEHIYLSLSLALCVCAGITMQQIEKNLLCVSPGHFMQREDNGPGWPWEKVLLQGKQPFFTILNIFHPTPHFLHSPLKCNKLWLTASRITKYGKILKEGSNNISYVF